jgi:hypothetical protein
MIQETSQERELEMGEDKLIKSSFHKLKSQQALAAKAS